MDHLELEETYNYGYKQDFDVEIIDGFYHHNVAQMNDKVRLFANYIQMLSRTKFCFRPNKAKAVLEDWLDTLGGPDLPQLLLETLNQPKGKKRSTYSSECDGSMLIKEMKDNYISGELERVYFDVPNVLPEGDVSLAEYETRIKECENCLKTVDNCHSKYLHDKKRGLISGNFDDWVNIR